MGLAYLRQSKNLAKINTLSTLKNIYHRKQNTIRFKNLLAGKTYQRYYAGAFVYKWSFFHSDWNAPAFVRDKQCQVRNTYIFFKIDISKIAKYKKNKIK
jgi:hypothetical protein